MKKIFIISLCLIGFFACKNEKTETTGEHEFVNNLISPKSCITYEQNMIVPEEYFFFKSIDFKSFVSQLKNKTVAKKIKSYIPFSNIECNNEDIQTKFVDDFSLNEIQSLLFDEEWALDTALFLMKKKVNSYSIVRNYIRHSELGDIPTKSVVATYNFANTGYNTPKTKGFRLIENNVAYEVPLVNDDNPEFLENMQVSQVVKTIIEKAICGNTQSYSFTFRDTSILRTLDEVKKSLGKETICYEEEDTETYEVDSVCVDKEIDMKEICGLAFIEDWYLNDSTMEILKEVKAIAPIRAYLHSNSGNTEPEMVKTIPFVMYLKNNDKGN